MARIFADARSLLAFFSYRRTISALSLIEVFPSFQNGVDQGTGGGFEWFNLSLCRNNDISRDFEANKSLVGLAGSFRRREIGITDNHHQIDVTVHIRPSPCVRAVQYYLLR